MKLHYILLFLAFLQKVYHQFTTKPFKWSYYVRKCHISGFNQASFGLLMTFAAYRCLTYMKKSHSDVVMRWKVAVREVGLSYREIAGLEFIFGNMYGMFAMGKKE